MNRGRDPRQQAVGRREVIRDQREIAVPCSYNDIFPERVTREHVDDVWYQLDITVPAAWGTAYPAEIRRGDAPRHGVDRRQRGDELVAGFPRVV